jgi:dTDP-4-dehydrorhamnose 3,5-epimerase
MHSAIPHGVELLPLTRHEDARGWVSEIFRRDRATGDPCQWNATLSEANVLRGVHVHVRHSDYLVVVSGRMHVGLFDIRPDSPTSGASAMLELSADALTSLHMPAGVMHGFYSSTRSLYVYGLDTYFAPADELGCSWSDPELGLAWPCTNPVVSDRDRRAGSLAQARAAWRAAAAPS